MHGHPEVRITSIVKFKNTKGEYWYRFAGAMNGKRIGDTVEMSAVDVEGMGMTAAQETAKRSLRGLAAYMQEQENA